MLCASIRFSARHVTFRSKLDGTYLEAVESNTKLLLFCILLEGLSLQLILRREVNTNDYSRILRVKKGG